MLLILEFLIFEIDVSNFKNFISEIKRLSNLISCFLYCVAGEGVLTREGESNTRLIKPHNEMIIYINHQMLS